MSYGLREAVVILHCDNMASIHITSSPGTFFNLFFTQGLVVLWDHSNFFNKEKIKSVSIWVFLSKRRNSIK